MARKEEVQEIIDAYYSDLKNKKGIKGKAICSLSVIPEVFPQLDFSNFPDKFKAQFYPLFCTGWNPGINEKLISNYKSRTDDCAPYAVIEVNNFGEVKSYNSSILEDCSSERQLPDGCVGCIVSRYYEWGIIQAFFDYLTLLQELGVSAPFFFNIAMLNVQGYTLFTSNDAIAIDGFSILQKEDIRPPLSYIRKAHFDTEQDVAKAIRPIFDYIWSEFGFERSYNYSGAGDWQPS